MNDMKRKIVLAFLLLPVFSGINAKSLVLPDLLKGDVVLQRQTDARIWGKAAPGAEVVLHTSWDGLYYKVNASPDSLWSVKVATEEAGFTRHSISVTSGDESETIDNILFGDVWFCGGQSNMEMPLKGMFNCAVDDAAEEILASGANEGLRYVTVAKHQAEKPEPGYFTEGVWHSSSPSSVSGFSATGYFFGQALSRALGIPIGLISCCWSGSFVEDWMSRELVERYPDQEVFGAAFTKAFTKMYYGMFEPASMFTVKGMIWYQGESNVGSPDYTERLMAAVELWKSGFELERLPFYLVEIAPYNYNKGYEMLSADLREQQLRVASLLPESGLACTNDLVYEYEFNNIHPAQKKAVGQRLAMLALSKTYGMGNPCEGPVYSGMTVKEGTAVILFENAQDGFYNYGEFKGFEVAGEDRVFHPAHAETTFVREQGTRGFMGRIAIKVSCPEVPVPVAVRYGYGPFVPGNLRNAAGLPAYPFRTDDWPLR